METGTLLASRFELTSRLGQGGIGEVWEAIDRQTNAIVAVKLLREMHQGSEMEARFAREGQLLARVRSPHVCALHEAVIDPETRVPFLVVERLEGVALARALPRHSPLPEAEATLYTGQILRGLAAVHDAGMIHRDLKPQNVFLAERGGRRSAVLIDFGIGKLIEDAEGLTTSAATLGSPRFMAPEQLGASAHVDERCDVYAAATIAFRMFAGKLPFDDDRPMHTLAMKTSYDPPSLGERSARTWPPALEQFFASCLARDPERRPRNGGAALEVWRSLGLASASASDPLGAPPTDTDDFDETPVLPRRRR